MNEIRMDVTEQQMDKLAGRVAELEAILDQLVSTLGTPEIAGRIGLRESQVRAIRDTFLTKASAELRHHNERAKAVAVAEKDRLFQRLRSEPGLAFPKERETLDELDAVIARKAKGPEPPSPVRKPTRSKSPTVKRKNR